MIKRYQPIRVILLVIPILLLLFVAPVFISEARLRFNPDSIQEDPNSKCEGGFWVESKDSFSYYGVYGIDRSSLDEQSHFIVFIEDKNINSILISHASIVIDGVGYPLSSIENRKYAFSDMDYGLWGSRSINFKLPQIPKRDLRLTIKSHLISAMDNYYPFNYDKTITVKNETSMVMMFNYMMISND